jgi:hypothetical protein
MYKTSTELILCGDFYVNYLNDNSIKHLLDSLLALFSLFSTVKFPTRTFNNSCSLIDNIYTNIHRHDFSVHPLINGLSDHDAQINTLSNIFISTPRHVFSYNRKVDSNSISKFTFMLSYENWEDVFLEKMSIEFLIISLTLTSETSMQVFQLLNHKTPINQDHD